MLLRVRSVLTFDPSLLPQGECMIVCLLELRVEVGVFSQQGVSV